MSKRGLRYVEELSEAFRHQLAIAFSSKDLLGYGLRSRLREGYTAADFRADVIAALLVAALALPMAMALALTVGVRPEHGLYTAIIAGVICALLGGTRLQVTGPTAALVVILIPIVDKYGLSGLLVSGMLAGVMLLSLGLARMGRLVQLVPHPVTAGLTMGIAVMIALLQLDDVLGVKLPRTDGTFAYLGALWDARAAINPWDVGVGVVTVALLLALPRVTKRIPAPLVALSAVSLLVVLFEHVIPGFHVATIASELSASIDGEIVRGVTPLPPLPVVPWHVDSAGRALDYQMIRELLPPAFAIAMLGAMESLMSATAADGMAGTTHDPNSELIALGIANIVVPFFGGIAATGALARTATNIRAGARSPIAAALHSVAVLAATIALASLISRVPIAALGGLLIVVARNLSESRHFVRLARIAPRADVMVMVTCFALAVAFDLVIAVTFGVLFAAFLFMRRMAVLTGAQLQTTSEIKSAVPDGVRVYKIAGPLFFGAAKTAMQALHVAGGKDHTVILALAHVPTIDATGLVALESVLDRLDRSKVNVILAGCVPEVADILDRAGIKREPGRLAYAPDVATAISMAIVHGASVGREATDGAAVRRTDGS
ncbi:MAG TPA: SulP family inorganic anion transporter [Kofleriaceae bacterium]|nr:SulP family inorganic anion transporter [Kofleriaceae bacterium]